jgi:hypothetical protein
MENHYTLTYLICILFQLSSCSQNMNKNNPSVQFLTISSGLTENHQTVSPILEKTLYYPKNTNRLVARVYEDGTLYYLVEKEPTNPNWVKISMLSTIGIEKLIATIAKCCQKKQKDIEFKANNMGSINWKLRKNSAAIVEFSVPISNDAQFSDFNELDIIINSYIQKGN